MPSSMAAVESAVISVNLSGPVLAWMIYDMLNSEGDQEGFLVGDVVTRMTEGISDTQLNFQKEQDFVCIRHYVPCDRVFSFYNSRGHVDDDAVKNTLGKDYKDLIGWYTFRRNTQLDVMLRERSVCHNLSNLMSASHRPFSVFGIFTGSSNERHSTLTNDYVFLSHAGSVFKPVPVVVVNLGDTSQVDYKMAPPIFLHNHIRYYEDVLKTDSSGAHGVGPEHASTNHVRNIQKELQTKLEDVCRKLHDTEIEHADLQKEVEFLREQVQRTAKNSRTSRDTASVETNRDGMSGDMAEKMAEETMLIQFDDGGDEKGTSEIVTAVVATNKEKTVGRHSSKSNKNITTFSADSGLESRRNAPASLRMPSSRTQSTSGLSSTLLAMTPRLSDPNVMEVDLADAPTSRTKSLSEKANRGR